MGVPSRFATEYPARVMELITVLEETARRRDMLGSFGLLAAAAVLTIPFERMRAAHPLHNEQRDAPLAAELKGLAKVRFSDARFWNEHPPKGWRQSRIMGAVDRVADWRDEEGRPSLSPEANTIDRRKAENVIRVHRNARAHGNIIYLDEKDREIAGNRMASMAFLSRYEESKEQQQQGTTYRVVVVPEEEFLRFVKAWAVWVSSFALDPAVVPAT